MGCSRPQRTRRCGVAADKWVVAIARQELQGNRGRGRNETTPCCLRVAGFRGRVQNRHVIWAAGVLGGGPSGNHDQGITAGFTPVSMDNLAAPTPGTLLSPMRAPAKTSREGRVPTRSGVIKWESHGNGHLPAHNDRASGTWAQGILNAAEPDRQFFYASHMWWPADGGDSRNRGMVLRVSTCVGGSADPPYQPLGQGDFIQG